MSTIKEFDIILDLFDDPIIPNEIQFNRNDMNTCKINLFLTKNGSVIDLTSASVKISFKKSDRKVIYQDCSVDDDLLGKCSVVLSSQSLSSKGVVYSDVTIAFADGKTVLTRSFTFSVQDSILTDEALESTNEFPALTKAIEAGDTLKNVDLDKIANLDKTIKDLDTNKADKGSIRQDTLLRPINVNEFDQATKELMTGGNVAVVGVNSTGQTNIIDKSLNRDKTKFYNRSTVNMVDESTMIIGGFYSPTYGTFTADATYKTTDLMRVYVGDIIKGNFATLVGYDQNYNVVTLPASVNGTKTMPAGIYYLRANFTTSTTYPVIHVVSSTNTNILVAPYEKVKYRDGQLELTSDNLSNDLLLKEHHLDIFDSVRTVNMFDKTRATLGRYNDTGAYAYNGTVTSNYIDVVDGDVVRTKTTGYITAYDINKNFVVGSSPTNTYTVPSGQGIKYVRTTTFEANLDTEMVVKNMNMPSLYVPYYTRTLKTKYGGGGSGSKLSNKKVNTIGDSITEAAWGGIKKYDAVIAEKYNMDLMNYGIGGTRIARADDREESFVSRYMNMRTDADLIFLMGGTNDIGKQLPIGTIDSTDEYTFMGALNVICNGLQSMYIGKPIGFATPILARGRDRTLCLQYADAMIAVCNKYNIPVLDLSRMAGINPENINVWNALYLTDDTVHLNGTGQTVLSRTIETFWNQIS